ncbi:MULTISPECIES: MAPEG family protein [Microbulbifer]|uniref:MAPEG family protein n=1 Tax=Microbulbifer TaxID=48073 RepID=UPI001E424CCF|nr:MULTISPECIES: MAPEG family protein [Microbulbifer]UHQ54450.1 MAPEG family protein [Microbulbifer sp. YPW16]
MSVALWCLLATSIMPYVFTVIAKVSGRGRYDNRAPRQYLEAQEGLSQRADWAQRNSFEALPVFAAAVLAAMVAGVAESWLAGLSLAFIGIRVIYGACYLCDWHGARSLVWFAGLACCIGLLVLAALAA